MANRTIIARMLLLLRMRCSRIAITMRMDRLNHKRPHKYGQQQPYRKNSIVGVSFHHAIFNSMGKSKQFCTNNQKKIVRMGTISTPTGVPLSITPYKRSAVRGFYDTKSL
jgi:hypothetical protein